MSHGAARPDRIRRLLVISCAVLVLRWHARALARPDANSYSPTNRARYASIVSTSIVYTVQGFHTGYVSDTRNSCSVGVTEDVSGRSALKAQEFDLVPEMDETVAFTAA